MQTNKDNRPTDWSEPVHRITNPPGNAISVSDTNIALCVWEQLGLLLERYQLQVTAENPTS